MRYFLNIMFTLTEEQEESAYNLYISEVRNLRLRLESCEDRLIRQIRTPLERDDVHESVLRISEQEVRPWARGPRPAQVGPRWPSPPTLRPLLRAAGATCELWPSSRLRQTGPVVQLCRSLGEREALRPRRSPGAAGPPCLALGVGPEGCAVRERLRVKLDCLGLASLEKEK